MGTIVEYKSEKDTYGYGDGLYYGPGYCDEDGYGYECGLEPDYDSDVS